MFSVRLKRKPDVFKFTRDALKLEYAMNVYQKFRDSKTGGPFYTLVWLSREADEGLTRSQGVKNLLFPLCSRCFVSAWVLDLRKNAGWFTVEKVPFFWSTSYPAKFGAFNGDLELVPSSIGPFLVFFWPSIRRYRIEYLAIYAALATKYFFHTHTHSHTHTWLSKWFTQRWPKP